MGTLLGSMSIALSGLQADQAAVQVTSNNIANASTPGYDRQIPIITESEPITANGIVFGNGVNVQSIQSVRDNVLNLQLNSQTQQQSSLSTYVNGMQQVEAVFNETSGTGLSSAITGFFNSIQALSANPSDSTLRQAVVDAGGTLAQGFNSASTQLQQVQSGVNQDVTQTVSQVNSIASQIAALNQQIASLQGVGQGTGDLVGQRDEALSQLSGLVGTSTVSADNGSVTVTVAGGSPLVVGNQAFQLTSQTDPSTGTAQVYSQGTDITAQITGGTLGGDIQVRDQGIPAIQESLDNLAASITSNMNTANAQGYDVNGAQGGNFFTPFTSSTPGSNQGQLPRCRCTSLIHQKWQPVRMVRWGVRGTCRISPIFKRRTPSTGRPSRVITRILLPELEVTFRTPPLPSKLPVWLSSNYKLNKLRFRECHWMKRRRTW